MEVKFDTKDLKWVGNLLGGVVIGSQLYRWNGEPCQVIACILSVVFVLFSPQVAKWLFKA